MRMRHNVAGEGDKKKTRRQAGLRGSAGLNYRSEVSERVAQADIKSVTLVADIKVGGQQ